MTQLSPMAQEHLRRLMAYNVRMDSNRDAYSATTLQAQIKALGLHGNQDLQILKDLGILVPGQTYLEIGAGTGRVVDYLTNIPRSEIFAVEHSQRFFSLLTQKYEGVSSIHLIKDHLFKPWDIQTESVDVALLMFSTMLEFSQDEQIDTFERLRIPLKKGGLVVVDNVDPNSFDPSKLPQYAVLNDDMLELQVPDEFGPPRSLKLTLLHWEKVLRIADISGFVMAFNPMRYDTGSSKRYCLVLKKL